MPINIHGNQYVTVAERVQAFHEEHKDHDVSITTEFLPIDNMVVCKATVTIGNKVFTGTSAANPSKTIEKQSPYEVSETSAVGRALGFAGFGIVEGIATADEIVKATQESVVETQYNAKSEDIADTVICPVHNVQCSHFQKGSDEWWAHKKDDGSWCNARNTKYNRS